MSAPSEMAGGQMSAIDEKGGECLGEQVSGGKCPYTCNGMEHDPNSEFLINSISK